MLRRIVLIILATVALQAQQFPQQPSLPDSIPQGPPPPVHLPNGKLQRDEILKADYKKSLADARKLSQLADELKADLEKSNYDVLSVDALKKVDEINRLSKHIHDRMKRY